MAGKEKEKAGNAPEGAAAENTVDAQATGFDFASEVLKAFGVTIEEAAKCISEHGKLLEELESLKLENQDLKKDVEFLKKVRDEQDAKIFELTSVESDSKTLRTENKKGEVKIKFVLSPAGRYLLPYNIGQEVSLKANQADELVEAKYAEYVR